MSYEDRIRIAEMQETKLNEDIDRFQGFVEVMLARLNLKTKIFPSLFTKLVTYSSSDANTVAKQKFEILERAQGRVSFQRCCFVRSGETQTVHANQFRSTSYSKVGYGLFPGNESGNKKDRERYRKGRLMKETTERQDLANHLILWL
jgi:hypothetical protein